MQPLEQQLINAFMKFTAKAGAGELVREFIRAVDQNGNPKLWNSVEMEKAIEFLNAKVDNFGKEDALLVINTLMRKFEIRSEDVNARAAAFSDKDGLTGVQGLQ
jgi:hypothetical protein